MAKYRVVTNGEEYKVQIRRFFIWFDFEYVAGIAPMEGYKLYSNICEYSEEDAWDKLKQVLDDLNKKARIKKYTKVSEKEL